MPFLAKLQEQAEWWSCGFGCRKLLKHVEQGQQIGKLISDKTGTMLWIVCQTFVFQKDFLDKANQHTGWDLVAASGQQSPGHVGILEANLSFGALQNKLDLIESWESYPESHTASSGSPHHLVLRLKINNRTNQGLSRSALWLLSILIR